MRKVFHFLWRIISAPFHLLTYPFRKAKQFIEQEPDDTPVPEVFAQTIQHPQMLLEHLDAMRKHLFRALAAMILTTAISVTFATRILDFLAEPVGGIEALRAIEVTESIGAFMRVSLLSGFALAFPYILFEAFAFINPGLKKRERVMVLIAVPAAALLFITGLAFAYFVMLPAALPFMLNFMGIETVPRPSNYIGFVTSLMFWIGIAFQFPLIIYAIAAMGLVNAKTLLKGWRFAIIGIAILSAMVTPTIDPVNMALVMAPMIFLYFVSILLASIAARTRGKSQAED